MKKLHYIILCAIALCLPAIAGAAASEAVSLSYRIGQSKPDMALVANRNSYEKLLSVISRYKNSGDSLAICITHYSAPDASNAINHNVGDLRAERLRRAVVSDAGVDPAVIDIADGKEGWALMRRIVTSVPGIEDREGILAAIDGDPQLRMKRLRRMNGGKTYNYLRIHVFPRMRSTLTVLVGNPEAVAEACKADEAVAFLGSDPAPDSPAADILMQPDNAARLVYLIGQAEPDMSRGATRAAYESILAEIQRRKEAGLPVAVYVTHFSGPDGINEINRNVGAARGESLRKSIAGDSPVDADAVTVVDNGAGWGEVRHIVASNPGIKNRRKIIEIIDGDPAVRVERLKHLDKGATYAWLREQVFPTLRSTLAVAVGDPEELQRRFGAGNVAAASSTEVIELSSPREAAGAVQSVRPANGLLDRWAFKTNLIYDAILAPSLEVECSVSPRWSVNLEYEMAWWKNKSKNKIYQVAVVSPEARWWFRSSERFRGHYLGAFPGFTWYDLENGGTGHRGHGWFGGVSYGFMFPVSSKLSFDAELGVGYMHLSYKDYEPRDGHHVYQRTKSAGYFGPLKVKFALVWRPWAVKKSK